MLRENESVDGAHTVLVDNDEWRTCHLGRGDVMKKIPSTTFFCLSQFPPKPRPFGDRAPRAVTTDVPYPRRTSSYESAPGIVSKAVEG